MAENNYMLAASGIEDPDTRVFQYFINTGQPQKALNFSIAHPGWRKNALWLKHTGVALQVLGDIAASDGHLLRSFDLASGDDVAQGAALANLAAGRIRVGGFHNDQKAHELAGNAVILNPGALAPKAIGAIAAGRLGDPGLNDAWARHLAVSVPNLVRRACFPQLYRDPDMGPFWRSAAAQEHLLHDFDERTLQ